MIKPSPSRDNTSDSEDKITSPDGTSTAGPTQSRSKQGRAGARKEVQWLPFIGNAVVVLLILIVCAVMIYPFIWMLSASFKPAAEVFLIPPTIIPNQPTFDNYAVVFNKMSVLANMYKNSIIVSGSVTLIQAFTCSAAAFVFAKLRFPGRNLLFALFMLSLMIPSQLTIIPNYITMRDLHLVDNLLSLILLGAFNAFGIFLIRQFFLTLPRELHEAARLDGANAFQSYLYVHLPLAVPVIAVNSILTFNATWGDFFTPLVFLKSLDNMTLPLGISLIQGVYSQQSPAVLIATLVVALVPVVLVFLIARRRLIEGIAMTGVKA